MREYLEYGDVTAAARRISGQVRPLAVAPFDVAPSGGSGVAWLGLEHLQFTGSFKARGARNFIEAHRADGSLPEAGVTIASGGNAGLACAWAAQQQGVRATIFLPETAPEVKVARLGGYGAEVRLVGEEYAEALAACREFVAETGALASHAYDNPLIAAGAGTVLEEFRARVPDLDTVVVAVGGGGLFAGVAAAARHHGIRVIAAEPERCCALNAAVRAGHPVDVTVDSVAADSLGARRASALAVHAAQQDGVSCVTVPDSEIVSARRMLWAEHRLAVEHAAATALAAYRAWQTGRHGETGAGAASDDWPPRGGGVPGGPGTTGIVLCGANTDLRTLSDEVEMG
ncbi:serine/threonine dehydratase [Streptomyces sp. NPDC090442]|uniref:serine/threonine dehydratase n=1 Tax=Streptomyces sp. NPDC090442 TaxID=3365962 RepID=UPI00382C459F